MITKRLSTRENVILFMCLGLVFIYVGHNFIFKSLKNNIVASEDKIKVSEKRLKNYLHILQKEHVVETEYKKYLAPFKQTGSDDQQMTSVLAEIESVANDISMRLTDIKPKRVKRIDFYNSFSVSLTMEGELPAIIRFLYALQNNPHFFKIDEIYFERSSVRTTELRCRLVLNKALIF